MKLSPKRLEVSELLPAMLLSALILAGAYAETSRPSSTPDDPSMKITVTTIR